MFNSEVGVKTAEDLLSGKFLTSIDGQYPSLALHLNKRDLYLFIEARNKGGALFGVSNCIAISELLATNQPGTLLCNIVERMIIDLNLNLK